MAKYAELSDGTRLEFPDNTEDSVIDATVKKHLSLTIPEEKPSLGERFKTGVQETLEGLGTAIQAPFLSNEELTQRFKEHQANQKPSAGSLEKVQQIAENQGYLAAGKEALSQVPGVIAEQAGNLGAVGAGALGGAALGAAFLPVIGAPIGALAGAGSALFGISAGSNIERQISEQLKNNEKVDPNLLAAYGTAAIQAGIDVIGGPEKFFVEQFGKVAGKQLTEQFYKEGLGKTIGMGIAKNIATEVPTEIGQKALERAQAQLPVTGDEANKEYKESGYQAWLASPIGAPIRMYEKGQAQTELANQQDEEQRKVEAQQAEQAKQDAEQQAYYTDIASHIKPNETSLQDVINRQVEAASQLSDKDKKQYAKELEAHANEPSGQLTHDENGHEVPLSSWDVYYRDHVAQIDAAEKEKTINEAEQGQTSTPGIEPVVQPVSNTAEAPEAVNEQTAAEYLSGLDTRFTNPSQIKKALKDTDYSALGPKKILDIYKTLPKQESIFGEEELNKTKPEEQITKPEEQVQVVKPEEQVQVVKPTEAPRYSVAQEEPSKISDRYPDATVEQKARLDMTNKEAAERSSKLTEGARQIERGEITHEDYQKLVNENKPVTAYNYVPKPESNEDMWRALSGKDKKDKLNAPIEEGKKVNVRLDIPAYTDHNVWVPTIHEGGKTIAHRSTSIINNVTMKLKEKPSLAIATRKPVFDKRAGKEIPTPKKPIATMEGEWENHTPEQAYAEAKKAMEEYNKGVGDWRQVGMDPERHSYFYDRETQEPITSADRVIQIGALVLAKNVQRGAKAKTDYPYSAAPSSSTTGFTAEKLKRTLTPEMRRLVESGKAVIHDTQETLPGENHPANVQGMTTADGVTHYVANKLTPETIQNVALHEMGVHVGMEKMVGPKVWENIKNQAMTNQGKAFDAARAAIPKDTPAHLHAEEALAYLVEKAPSLPIVHRVVSAVRNWARTTLGANLKLTEADARHLATKALRKEANTSERTARNGDTRYSIQTPQNDADLRAATEVYATPKPTKKTSATDRVLAAGKYVSESPVSQLVDDLKGGLDKFRTQVASSGSPIQREYQKRFKGALTNPLTKEISGHFLMDQAADSAKFTLAAAQQGRPVIENGVARIEKDANNLDNLQVLYKKLADRIGSRSDADHAASAYLQAQRYQHLLNRNTEIQGQIDALGTSASAKSKVEKLKKLLVKVTPEQAAAIDSGLAYGERHPEIKQIADMWKAIKDGIVDFQENTGVISKELADKYRADSAYVPLYRVIDDIEKTNPGYRSKVMGIAGVNAEKHFTGSDKDVHDVFANMVQRVAWGIQNGLRNHANQRVAEDLGVVDDEGHTIYHNAPPKDRANYSAPVWIEGKQKWVEYSDPSMVTAIKGIEPIAHPIITMFGSASRLLRMSVTSLPMFQVIMIAKDAPRAATQSGVNKPFELMGRVVKNGFTLYADMLKGRENEIVKEMARAGVTGGYSQNPQELSAHINRKYNQEANTLVQKFLDKIEEISAISDLAQRKAIYEQTLKETGDKILAEDRARNIVNWNRHGADPMVRVLAQTVPFMNAYIQSMDVLLNTMNGTGISAKEKSIARKEFYRTAMNLSILSFVYAMAVGGDDEYQKMNDKDKINTLVIPGIGKIPIASEVGFLYKAFPEMLYQYVSREDTKNPMDATKLQSALWNSFANAMLSPNMMPQLAKPAIEAATNHSFLTGNELIGPHLKDKEAALQFNESTSELGKLLGSTGLIAPIKADHLIKGYGGTLASLTLMLTDAIVDQFSDVKRPAQSLYKNPIIGSFVNDPRYKDQIDSYYDLLEESNKVAGSLKRLKDLGRVDEAKEYQAEHKDMLRTRSQVLSLQRQMTTLRAQHVKVVSDPSLTADEKRQRLDALEERMGKATRNINLLRVKAGM